ncbi:MAG: transposase [Candidatus Marinimicrobia bacterium]|nr:transposase [Candidatus Neomarinimicrobiota bacterium]
MKNVSYAIALKDNIGAYVRRKNKNLITWKKTKLQFFDSNECEVAMGLYPIKNLGNLRVVFIRAPKKDQQLNLLDDPSESGYRHYSIVTNIDSFDMNEEEIIDFYRQRSTAENYIREQKYGYDFLHFPCKRLKANKVFGLAGTISHNLMRALSFMMDQKEKRVRGKNGKRKTVIQLGYYAKKIRTKLINIAGKIVCSARKMKLRLTRHNWEVYEKIMCKITNTKQRYVPYKTLSELFNNRITGTTNLAMSPRADTGP